MSRQPFSLKYRPQNFADLEHHSAVKKVLINSIINNNLANAILLYGCRGTGKTSIARIIAKAINCTNLLENHEPCNSCDTCRNIITGSYADVFEIDAASQNSVENIRELIENTKYLPVSGKYKVFILDEAHMLSTSAFNALLKLLEEPPEYIKLLLLTTEYQKIPLTIVSRCQRLHLECITKNIIIERLKTIAEKENIQIDKKSQEILARVAKGSLRDAISLLEHAAIISVGNIEAQTLGQIIGFQENEEEIANLFLNIIEHNLEATLQLTDALYKKIIYLDAFFEKILDILSELISLCIANDLESGNYEYILNISQETLQKLRSVRDYKIFNDFFEIFSKSLYFLKNGYYENHFNLFKISVLKTFAHSTSSQPSGIVTQSQQKEQNIQEREERGKIENNPILPPKNIISEQVVENNSKNQARVKFSHKEILQILEKYQDSILMNLISTSKIKLDYEKLIIYEESNVPSKYFQALLKILRAELSQEWKIVIPQFKLPQNTSQEVLSEFLQSEFFKNLSEHLNILEKNVKII